MDKDNKNTEVVPFLTSFYRSQASSFIATIVDYSVYFLLFFVFGVHYAISSASGNIFGAVVSFYLGRNWAFKNKEGKITTQAIKYALTSISSSLINTSLIIYATEKLAFDPTISKVIISILVGAFYNFFMFRYFVYKK